MASLTYANIETRCINQLRISSTHTAEVTKVQALINETYRDLYVMMDWWWLRKRTVINTLADITTGTVSVTKDSTTVTFSSAPAVDLDRYVLLIPGDSGDSQAVYRISAHTAASATATLDAAFTGTTNATAGYKLYRDAYSLPTDCGKVLKVRRFGFQEPIDLMDPNDLFDLKEYDQSVGKPQWASVYDFATTGDPTTARQLIVHPYPDDTYRLEVMYKQALNTELSSSTQPLIPDDFRQILVYGTLATGYPIFLNDAERGQFFTSKFDNLLTRMMLAQRERGDESPYIVMDDRYRSRVTRGRRGRVTLGSWFDRLPYRP